MKAAHGLGRGASSKVIEIWITRIARRLMKRCSPEEVTDVVSGVRPAWMEDDMIFEAAEAVASLRDQPAAAGAAHTPSVNLAARGFDLYCTEHHDQLLEKARSAKRFKCYAGKTLTELIKFAGGRAWKRLSKGEKQGWVSAASLTSGRPRLRTITGQFCRLPQEGDGQAAASDTAAEIAAVVPTKLKPSVAMKLGQGFVNAAASILDGSGECKRG